MQNDYTYSRMNSLKKTPKYLPFRSGTWKFEVGLHAIDLNDWLDVDEHYDSDIEEKQELRQKFSSRIFQELPESRDSQEEVFDLIESLLVKMPDSFYNKDQLEAFRYVDHIRLMSNINRMRMMFKQSNEYSLLNYISEVIQEDLCIMSRRDKDWVLTAASVHFPSFWNLFHKMKKPMSLIHDPVPKWNDRIDDVISIRMDNMSRGIPFQRFNWTLTTEAKRFQPDSERTYKAITPQEVGSEIFMRVERQVLYKLEKTGDILFTIRTYMHPLSFLKENESLRGPFVSALLDCEESILAHKGISMHKDSILEFLTC